MIRIAIVDDQELLRAGFAMILGAQEDMEVVGEAGDGLEALGLVRDVRPDVLVMDVRMPRMDGIEATRMLQREPAPVPRVLMLTTFDLDEYVYEAMRAGASGFMLKDVPREQLIAAVRTVAAGDSLLAPAITRRLIEEFVRRPAPGEGVPERLRELTERELDVMREVARGSTNAEVAAALHLSEATVRTHVSHLLAKLGLRDRVQVVVAAYETGLVRPGDGA